MLNILGTEYDIKVVTSSEKMEYTESDGLAELYSKELYVLIEKPDPAHVKDIHKYRERVLLHEIIHAFLYESGSEHYKDEELVHYLSVMIPKIMGAYEECKHIIPRDYVLSQDRGQVFVVDPFDKAERVTCLEEADDKESRSK